MVLHFYAAGLLLLAALPAVMMLRNLPLFRPLPTASEDAMQAAASGERVAVLIPARDEAASIGACLQHVLACPWPDLEVWVLDDGSTDATRSICESWAGRDARVSIIEGLALPEGWNGKQHACWRLSQATQASWLLFIDADVRLTADAIPRLLSSASSQQVDLLSGFPFQETRTWSEKLLIPLMHTILLGYLPLDRMRVSTGPEFAAGCGQLFFARHEAYRAVDGHRAIAQSRHDGIQLPRVFRRHGLKTDIFDASDLAVCRMYTNAREVIRGLLKNATEGLASDKTIIPFTILLLGGAVLPSVSFWCSLAGSGAWYLTLAFAVAVVLSYCPRMMAAKRFRQSWLGAVLHPVAVLLFLSLQWVAWAAERCGYRVTWRGRN